MNNNVDLTKLKIGYVPLSKTLDAPGDKRRFCFYAKQRNLNFQIVDPSQKYDLIILTQSADLSIWSNYDRGGAKLVYDITDSYLAVPRNEIKGRLRGLAKYLSGQSKYLNLDQWKSIETMCQRADAVICTTKEQALDILPFNANVHQILDVHSSVLDLPKSNYQLNKVFNIVWEGQATNAFQLKILSSVFAKLQKKYEIALHLVTDLTYKQFLGKYWNVHTLNVVKKLCDRVFVYDWNELTCSKIITSCDLAIIPIDLCNALVKGKPENKLLLFWRMGMPVITSATPAYDRAMSKIDLEMTCQTEQDWYDKIEAMILDHLLRERAAVRGKKCALSHYSDQVTFNHWDEVINSCL